MRSALKVFWLLLKKVPAVVAICAGLGALQGSAAVRVDPPTPETWAMSVEVCQDWPQGLVDAVQRGMVRMAPQCRWFVYGTVDRSDLRIWPSLDACEAFDLPGAANGFFIRARRCQSLPHGRR
jgi:hypothetical protein